MWVSEGPPRLLAKDLKQAAVRSGHANEQTKTDWRNSLDVSTTWSWSWRNKIAVLHPSIQRAKYSRALKKHFVATMLLDHPMIYCSLLWGGSPKRSLHLFLLQKPFWSRHSKSLPTPDLETFMTLMQNCVAGEGSESSCPVHADPPWCDFAKLELHNNNPT